MLPCILRLARARCTTLLIGAFTILVPFPHASRPGLPWPCVHIAKLASPGPGGLEQYAGRVGDIPPEMIRAFVIRGALPPFGRDQTMCI
jgi:hypothetical protein